MTREEAIEIIRDIDKAYRTFTKTEIQAFEMAIQALEQEPCREFEDYENEIEGLQNRLDIAEYDKERLREEVTNLEAKIKALEKEPCDDAVSRQAVLEMAYDMSEIDGEHFTEPCMVVDVEDIQKLPSVKPQEPKTGYREYNDIYDHYLCGNCKTVVMDYDNFCPNCGCRMYEPQESEVEE